MKIQLTEPTAEALRDSLVTLYTLKLDRLKDELSRWPTQDVNHMVASEKIKLLQFLIAELERIEIMK